MTQPHIGFIGLGIMGRPMAQRLLAAGFPLRVWARRPEVLAPLEAAGARVCDSPRELAREAGVVFLAVSGGADVEELVLGENGLIGGLRPGSVVVDHSTIEPATARHVAARLAEVGADFLDAPVSGGEQGAIDGTLSIMVGGRAEALGRVRHLLEVLGRHIVHVGPSGAGQLAKACNQLVVAQTMQAVGEAITLCEAAGVDAGRMREALLGGFAYSRILEVHGQRMLAGDFRPGFKAHLHQKDLGIALSAAAEAGVALPGTALAAQLMNALVGSGGAERDSAALVTVQRRLNGLSEESA